MRTYKNLFNQIIGGKEKISNKNSNNSTLKNDKALLEFIKNPIFLFQLVFIFISVIIFYNFKFIPGKIYFVYAIILIIIINIIIDLDKTKGRVIKKIVDPKAEAKKKRDKLYKNEPYKINYTNPFITNLDNINFNFIVQYNRGDFKTYLFNKIDELLISKYITFYKVLSFNKNKLTDSLLIKKDFDINDNYTNIFLGLASKNNDLNNINIKNLKNTEVQQITNSSIYFKTKSLILMRGNILQIPALGLDEKQKTIATNVDLNEIDEKELYIYIFERNDLNKYKEKDNLTIIKNDKNDKNRCTLIDTNLNANTQYVAHISYLNKYDKRLPQFNNNDTIDDYLNYLMEIEKKTHNDASEIYRTTINKFLIEKDSSNSLYIPMISNEIKTTNNKDSEDADTSKTTLNNSNDLNQLKDLFDNYIYNEKDGAALIAKIKRIEYNFYNDDSSFQVKKDKLYFPRIESNNYYPTDHAMFVNNKERYFISNFYPYLVIPVILIDKPNININKPLFYENTKDIQKNTKQRNWLIKEYDKIIETQFKSYIFNIKSNYRVYNKSNAELSYNMLSDTIDILDENGLIEFTTLNDKLFDDFSNNVNINKQANYYKIIQNKTNDIRYNTYNNLNKSKNIAGQYAFNITIENIITAVDYNMKELERDTMPYLKIEYGLLKQNGRIVEIDKKTSVYGIINLSISNDKNKYYDKNKHVPFLYNKLKDEIFSKTREITLDKEEYINELNKIKDNITLSNNPDKYILKDIQIKLKQLNSTYNNNKIFISENFINTEYLYDYKIKMNMIISKILEYNFKQNLLSIQEWNFDFSKLKLIKFNNLLRYNNNKKLILKNIPLTNYNITKHFKDIYELREHYRIFLINMYKDLWFITETNKPEDYLSDYFININSKYYYFDSNKARKYDIYFYKNIDNIINKTPIVHNIKEEGSIKYFIKHICIKQNLAIKSNLSSNLKEYINKNNIKQSDTIKYRPTYKYKASISEGDLVLMYDSDKYYNNFETNKTYYKNFIENLDINNMTKHIKLIKNNLIININKNITITPSNEKIYDTIENNIDIKTDIIPELYNRKFIYISETSLNNYKGKYNYPYFIKIGKNVESINIGKTEQGYSLPNIKLIENECIIDNNNNNNNINYETNIFPIINAYTLNNNILNDAVNRDDTKSFSKDNITLLELPSNIIWEGDETNNENEKIFNELSDSVKNKYYKIFDYTDNFINNKNDNLLGDNLIIKDIIFDKNTPTRFKIKLNYNIENEHIIEELFNNIKNTKIYEKYVTFHNFIDENIEDLRINYLLNNISFSLIKQNSLYKIYNICKNTNFNNNFNNYSIEFETYYPVFTNDIVFNNNDLNIISLLNTTIKIKKYINEDKKQEILIKDVDTYNIKNNICDYIANINECFNDYRVESTKNENNINTNIWNINDFYYNKELIKFKINDIINANSDSQRNTFMTRLIDNIIFNEICKIHYKIPKKIGIIRKSNTGIDRYVYDNQIYIPYYKRNQNISSININTDDNICLNYSDDINKNSINKNNVTINNLAIYNISIATYKQYYYYYKNIFINILGLYDDIDFECNNFIQLGKSILNKNKKLNQSTKLSSLKKYIKIPLNLNKYLTFSDNYMLFVRKTKKLLEDNNTELTEDILGLPVIVNNTYFDSLYLSKYSSNTENTKKCKKFLKQFIKQFKIGMYGFTQNIAEEICSRIYTVYNDKLCKENGTTEYNFNSDNKFNIENYNHNKNRDKCFTTIFNDQEYSEKKNLINKNKWLFYENCDDQKNAGNIIDEKNNICFKKDNKLGNNLKKNSPDIYNFLSDVNLSSHRLSTLEDIENGLVKGMSVEGYGFIKDKDLYSYSPLVKPTIKENIIDNKKFIDYNLEYINRSDIDNYNNKGLYCYGRKPDNTKLSKENDAAIFYFNQKKIKQNIRDIKKYENIEYFNVPKENYSAWN